MIRKTVLAAVTTTALAGAVYPATASADLGTPPPCVKVTDLTAPTFEVRQCGVSDVDQFRAGLENNGNAYCGPTSLYNVMHYWSHVQKAPIGWVTTRVGNLDPQQQSDYNVITNSLGRIGVDAKYDGGTKMGNLRTAWNIATKPARDAGWSTADGNLSTTQTSDFAGDLAKRLAQGPLQLVYGRYKDGPQAGSLQRNGGHIVTVVSAKGAFNDTTVVLKLADPGRAGDHGQDGYLTTQSAYESLEVYLARKIIWEYVPVADDENTPEDESAQPGTYRYVERWELTGPRYTGTTRQFVESFNWFAMAKPVG